MTTSNGTYEHQTTVRTTLEQLGETTLAAPATILIGAVGELRLDWFGPHQPSTDESR